MRLDAPDLGNDIVSLEVFGRQHHEMLREADPTDCMWRWLPALPCGTSFEAYLDYAECEKMKEKIVPFAVFRKADRAFAGITAYGLVDRLHRRVRITSTWHPEPMRGTLVFPATQVALIQRALDWGARRIAWTLDTRNASAIAAFARLGAKHEGTVRSFMRMTDGTWADHHIFAMTRDEAHNTVSSIEELIKAREGFAERG